MSFEYFGLFNQAVNRVFLDGRHCLRPLYIDLDEHAAREVAELLDIPPGELPAYAAIAVSETLQHAYLNPYHWHLENAQAWIKAGRQEQPPFTGLLAALSLAAEKMREDQQFSATNYYERLFEVLDVDDNGLKTRLKQHARSTRQFWRELNHWLTEHDFEIGRPTARQVNSWAYVSYALSQALVRDADREKFHDLFKEFDLSPLDEISESEMVLFIHDWITGNGANAWLKRLWQSPDLRERVAAAALTELETWDGGIQEGGVKNRRLGWTAYFTTFPRKSVNLLLTTVGAEQEEELCLGLPAATSQATRGAFEGCQDRLRLARAPTGDFSILEPTAAIEIGMLLLASFEFDCESGDTYGHIARPVVPLARLETGTYFREVQRVTLLRRHCVLCHEEWAPRVRVHLEKCARPGFQERSAKDLAGVPPGWVLFEDVEVTRVLETVTNDMAVLTPLAEGVAIQVEGGLRLAPQIWHCKSPPSVLATSDKGAFELVVRTHGDDEDNELARKASSGGSCVIPSRVLSAGENAELSVVAIRQGNETGERNFALRDANIPRSMRGQEKAYDLSGGAPSSFLSASPLSSLASAKATLEGMQLRGEVETPHGRPSDFEGETVDVSATEDEVIPDYKTSAVANVSETCVIRGHHYWICQPARKGDTPWEAKRMECRDCHVSVVLRNRGRWNRHARHARAGGGPSTRVIAPTIVRQRDEVPLDLVFDGLCYLGAGTWNAFQSLASAHSEDPWYASSLARELHDLGHLDLECDNAGRARGWSVAAPVLVITGKGEGYLAGFRSDHLVDEVGDALESLDAEYFPSTMPGRLTRQAWKGLSHGAATRALAEIRDPHGRPVRVCEPPARAIAALGPTLDELLSVSSPVHLESKDGLQVFLPRKGGWSNTPAADVPGAYRTNFAGRRYFVRRDDGSCLATTHSLAKVFAARLEGVALHGYDSARNRFFGVLGCDPPGLYSRALVSCSGELPRKEANRVSYADVPREVAAAILSKLYGST